MYNIEFVYQALNEAQKNAVADLWMRNHVLSPAQIQQRLTEVSVLIYHGDLLTGVSTLYIQDLAGPDNPFFFFRMFVDPRYRGSLKLGMETLRLNFNKLADYQHGRAFGLALELENTKLAHMAATTSNMRRLGWSYYAKNPRGLQIWYVRFDEPRGMFKNNIF